MPAFGKSVRILAVAATALSLYAGAVSAQQLVVPADRLELGRQGRWAEIKALDNDARLHQHLREHGRFMEQQRRQEARPRQELKVPRVKRSCRPPIHGNAYLPATCN